MCLRGKWVYITAALTGYCGLFGALWVNARLSGDAVSAVSTPSPERRPSDGWFFRHGRLDAVEREFPNVPAQWAMIFGSTGSAAQPSDDVRVVLSAGTVVAVEWRSRFGIRRAVRYVTPDGRKGYYTPDGRLSRDVFLDSPIATPTISSRFGQRLDPWWHRLSTHGGVDYAAAVGTPVRAIGDGLVVTQGTQGSYGNTLVLAHGDRVESLYGHLAAYANGLRVGQSVHQGDVIGYVGQTGLATGPHLHFEFRVDRRRVDPSSVRAAAPSAIAVALQPDFHHQAAAAWAALDGRANLEGSRESAVHARVTQPSLDPW
jgi:murein DD-endopeptidase MepM/ murein hydrolase activator NlpD